MRDSGGQSGRNGKKPPQSEPVDAKIAGIAARQFGLITLVQLYSLGLTYTEVHRRVQKGRLFPLHRGVFAVGRPDIAPRGHLKAGLLALGEASFLSHRASLAVQGLGAIDTRRIELTVVASSTPKRPGLIIHRTATAPHRHEIRSRFGLRYSSFARAMLEVAPRERPDELRRLVAEGLRRGVADLSAVEQTLARHPRAPGAGTLQAALQRYLDTTDRNYELERSFDAELAGDPRFPPYEKNLHAGGYEIDCLFGAQRLAVELDGRPFHVALADFDRDRAKDTWLQRRGLRIMRISDFMWDYERSEAIDNLLALLALGGWIPGAVSRAA